MASDYKMAAPISLSPNSCGIRVSGEIQLFNGKRKTLENSEITESLSYCNLNHLGYWALLKYQSANLLL